jgi:hypothetical protein
MSEKVTCGRDGGTEAARAICAGAMIVSGRLKEDGKLSSGGWSVV